MANYDLLQDFNVSDDTDYVSVSPHWVIAVIRFNQPLTFSRTKLFSGNPNSVSFNEDNSVITQTREVLIIDDDCINLQIQSVKESYTSSMSAVLMEGTVNYLSDILPTDWVLAWIVNDQETAKDLKKRISNLNTCNGFTDGLKFVGRVQGVRKSIHQDTNTGVRTVRYQLQAVGGKEFDSSIFYDQYLAEKETSMGQFLTKFNVGISDIFKTSADKARKGKGGIDSNLVIPILLKLLLGTGIPPRAASPGHLQIATGLTSTAEAPYAYAVPSEIGKLLGRDQPSKPNGVLSYVDCIEILIGLQKYSNKTDNQITIFAPDGVAVSNIPPPPTGIRSPNYNASLRTTQYPLKGEFLPKPIPLVNKPVWSVIQQFLNEAINEMYFTLRANPEGFVVPTLVIRQLPFSTHPAVSALGADVTGFLELPRWGCPTILIKELDVGRSDATHFNFIHVYGQASADVGGLGLTQQIVRNPPIRDEQDIKRNGLRPYMQTVACSINDTLTGPREWMNILTDFLMGQQLTLNGTVTLQGIQSPICPGDNIEIDTVVYHIESVAHICSIAATGQKQFTTTLSLTHGIRSDSPANLEKLSLKSIEVPAKPDPTFSGDIYSSVINRNYTVKNSPLLYNVPETQVLVVGDRNLNPDIFIYSGISVSDLTHLDAGITVDSREDE